ncbi:MAG: YqeG family HAD IIIA-type phosphatase [Bacteroidales bacterium]|nr:YqeG family HAD IIIA-type phosphatase [Bacteroidales bacterium]
MTDYFPNEYMESAYSIDYEALYRKGFRGIIFDIDNTLVPHGADCTPRADALFRHLTRIGFKTLLLSNNNAERVERFNRTIGTLAISDASKPATDSFHEAMRQLGTNSGNTLMIGDTIHTDILGANRAGLNSILVKYIGYYDKGRKGLRRKLESAILLFFPLIHRRRRIL